LRHQLLQHAWVNSTHARTGATRPTWTHAGTTWTHAGTTWTHAAGAELLDELTGVELPHAPTHQTGRGSGHLTHTGWRLLSAAPLLKIWTAATATRTLAAAHTSSLWLASLPTTSTLSPPLPATTTFLFIVALTWGHSYLLC
jgi:hypothetical protein